MNFRNRMNHNKIRYNYNKDKADIRLSCYYFLYFIFYVQDARQKQSEKTFRRGNFRIIISNLCRDIS